MRLGKTTAAHKMMLYAAKSMATLAVELIRDEALLAKARAEHKKRVGPNGYRCPIPAGVKPARHERVFQKRVTRVPQSAEIAKGACFGRRLSCPCAKEHGKAGNLAPFLRGGGAGKGQCEDH